MYICGPTVYGHAHLGHAKSYISFDVLVSISAISRLLRCYLRAEYYRVGHLTDDADAGEDKIIVAAKRENKHPMAVAEFYTRSYLKIWMNSIASGPISAREPAANSLNRLNLSKRLIKKGLPTK